MQREKGSVISKPILLFFRSLIFSVKPVGAAIQSEPIAKNFEGIEKRADGLNVKGRELFASAALIQCW